MLKQPSFFFAIYLQTRVCEVWNFEVKLASFTAERNILCLLKDIPNFIFIHIVLKFPLRNHFGTRSKFDGDIIEDT